MVLFINKTMCYEISSEVGFVGHRDVFRTLSTNYDGSFLQK